MRQYKLKKCKRVHGFHFAPDGSRVLAVGGAEARMIDCAVWLDLATGESCGRIEQLSSCYAVDPKLTRFAVGGADQWRQGTRPAALASVQWTAFDLIAASEVEWETFSAPPRKKPLTFRQVSGLEFDLTGERIAVGHVKGVNYDLSIVRLDDPDDRIDIRTAESSSVMAFNASGTRIASTGGLDCDPTVNVFDVGKAKLVFSFEPRGTVTRCLRFLPDDRLVVVNANRVYVLPAKGGEPEFTLEGHPKQVNAVTLTPDGTQLLTASHDGSIRTWNANTGEPGPAFDWDIGPITAVAFAPDGLTCTAAGLKGEVVVWDVDE